MAASQTATRIRDRQMNNRSSTAMSEQPYEMAMFGVGRAAYLATWKVNSVPPMRPLLSFNSIQN